MLASQGSVEVSVVLAGVALVVLVVGVLAVVLTRHSRLEPVRDDQVARGENQRATEGRRGHGHGPTPQRRAARGGLG